MGDLDLGALGLSEALKLQQQIAEQVRQSVEEQKARLRDEISALAQATNRSVAVVLNDLFPVQPLPPKYRHPDDPTKTWSGKGSAPKWLKAHMDATGAPLETYLIP